MNGKLRIDVLSATTRRLIERIIAANLFITGGYHAMRRVFAGDDAANHFVTEMQYGTGLENPLAGDEQLQMPITPIKGVTPSYPDNTTVEFEAYLLAGEGNGFPISEAGLRSANATLMARTIFAPRDKTSDYIFRFTWRLLS